MQIIEISQFLNPVILLIDVVAHECIIS